MKMKNKIEKRRLVPFDEGCQVVHIVGCHCCMRNQDVMASVLSYAGVRWLRKGPVLFLLYKTVDFVLCASKKFNGKGTMLRKILKKLMPGDSNNLFLGSDDRSDDEGGSYRASSSSSSRMGWRWHRRPFINLQASTIFGCLVSPPQTSTSMLTPANNEKMPQEEKRENISPDQDIDFCTLGMFIIGVFFSLSHCQLCKCRLHLLTRLSCHIPHLEVSLEYKF